MPNEREELPGCDAMRKDRRPVARGILDGGHVIVGNEPPMFGQRAQFVEVRREQRHRRLLFESEQELAHRLRDRETVERAGPAADFID